MRKIVRLFVLEVPAVKAAREVRVNRHTVERVYHQIRLAIARECERDALLDGEVEADKSYFGGKRKGMRGRGAAGKVAVFGLLKRNGRVYTRPLPDVGRSTLWKVIHQKVPRGSTIYTDAFASYDGLITDGYAHIRIDHGKTFAASKRRHINGIENFWGFAKTKLRRYYGVRRSPFFLYLKEMEFRFNHRKEDLGLLIEKILRRRGRKLN